MSLPLLLLSLALSQQPAEPKAAPPATAQPGPPEENPPEEDASLAPKEYAFNPIQAKREVRVGDYYMKKRNYRGAAARYREATRWDSEMAEAFRKLGEAEELQDELKLAREAYEKFLQISPKSKEAAEVKKRLQKLPAA